MKELAVIAEFTRCGINRCATMLLPKFLLVCLYNFILLLLAGTVEGDLGYLGDLLGVGGAGLQHLHLLVHVRRVHPLAL